MKELKIDYAEIEQNILIPLRDIQMLYINDIIPQCTDLTQLDYYQEGEAKEIFEMYAAILGKLSETADMYGYAYRLAEKIKSNMQKLDEMLALIIGNQMGGGKMSRKE